MKLAIASDLHYDHWTQGYDLLASVASSVDVIVVAGDLAIPSCLAAALTRLDTMGVPVVAVLGNHDYVGESKDTVEAIADGWDNVHVLKDSSVTIGGIKFLGGTLWYQSEPDSNFFDFYKIPKIRDWYKQASIKTCEYLLENAGPTDVVVTHHLPTWRSVNPRWARSWSTKYFVCPEAELVLEATSPMIWIHGHTHDACDYMYNKTRVICSPCGYQGENIGWKPKVVEI